MESKPSVPPRSPGGGRRRGRRGGRGRGPRRTATAAPVGEIAAPAPVAPVSGPSTQAESPVEQIEPPIRVSEMPVRPAPSKLKFQAAPPATRQAASHAVRQAAPVPVARVPKQGGSVIGQTVEEVRQIVESLEQALSQMEEVLRLVELAEHQKADDEKEIESLRRALHKLQPPHREQREDRSR